MNVLVINSGSSSIKYKLYAMPSEKLVAKGFLEHIGEGGADNLPNHQAGLKQILSEIKDIDAVGHRVVHGAEYFHAPTLVDADVIKKIRKCSAIAPLHNPANLLGITACKKLLPGVPQVVVFDTAFHQTMPKHAYLYPLPYDLYEKHGIRKYGFHGTSHEYVAREAAKLLGKPFDEVKIVSCHLGNGCSMAAIDGGVSVDTSMGFTPLEGLIMGTRSGDIDPALASHIMKIKKLDTVGLDTLLNTASGLKGISGTSNDMRDLEVLAAKGDERAALAIERFLYRIKKYIGSYIAAMGGCDAVVFTAGIAENMEAVRTGATANLKNYMKKMPKILTIRTDEEGMIARQTYALLKKGKK